MHTGYMYRAIHTYKYTTYTANDDRFYIRDRWAFKLGKHHRLNVTQKQSIYAKFLWL